MRISDWSSDVCSSDLDITIKRDGEDIVVGRPVRVDNRLRRVAEIKQIAFAIGHIETVGEMCFIQRPRPSEKVVKPVFAGGNEITELELHVLRPTFDGYVGGDFGFVPVSDGILFARPEYNPFHVIELGRASCRERVCQYV